MCGIAGLVGVNLKDEKLTLLRKMNSALRHRGPDGEAYWMNESQTVAFGHNRLAVIDLSAAAAQPMHKNFGDSSLTIVYNGEIYNYIELRTDLEKKGYAFSTKSDTEVLLALYHYYKAAALNLIDGMFAFAIWDEEKQELFAARDRFGEKPFYYTIENNILFFASEMKALWAAGITKTINHTALLNYLGAGLINTGNTKGTTFYTNIQQLPPGYFLVYKSSNNSPILKQYYFLDKNKEAANTVEEAKHKLLNLLNASVQKRLRSDVPVGTSLSGGLDSSTIAAIIANTDGVNNNFKTFSAVFPGYEKDETAFIQQIATNFNLINYTIAPTVKDFEQDFAKLMYHQEEPFQSSSIFVQYKVYALAKQHGVTVLLDGQGADEILAGYHKYYHWYWQQLLREGKFSTLLKEIKAAKINGVNINWSYKNYAAAMLPFLTVKQLEKKVKNELRQELLSPDYFKAHYKPSTIAKPIVKTLNDILHNDTFDNGLENLLRYADRNAMAHGVEVRLPFLLHELVEFVFSLPASFKINNGFTKYILRAAMQPYLPNNIVWRKDKIGFEPPQKSWLLASAMQAYIQDATNKLKQEKIIHKHFSYTSLQLTNAHEANNTAWRVLCAAQYL
jgi:asparagine synthase (glutamine-hydrolysing)